uniref:Uncharacterized protein n=1 Tax=Mustela putorius furo TaxID=9669 RepID=M3Z671_MUSPF
MYMGEPHSVAAIILLCRYRANPKSAAGQGGKGVFVRRAAPAPHPPNSPAPRPALASPILTRMLLGLARRPPGLDSRMFWGFRSRWMMPLLWSRRMAPAICCRKSRMVSSLSVRMAAGRGSEGSARYQGEGLQAPQAPAQRPSTAPPQRPWGPCPALTPWAHLLPGLRATMPLTARAAADAPSLYPQTSPGGLQSACPPPPRGQPGLAGDPARSGQPSGPQSSRPGASGTLWGQAAIRRHHSPAKHISPAHKGPSRPLCPAEPIHLPQQVRGDRRPPPPSGCPAGWVRARLGAQPRAEGRPLTVQVVGQVPAVTVLQQTISTAWSAALPGPPTTLHQPPAPGLLPGAGVPRNSYLKRSGEGLIAPQTPATATGAVDGGALHPWAYDQPLLPRRQGTRTQESPAPPSSRPGPRELTSMTR